MLPAESGGRVGGCSSPVDHGVGESDASLLGFLLEGTRSSAGLRQELQSWAGLGGEAETRDPRACAPCQSAQRGRDILVTKEADGASGVRKTSSRTERGTKAPGSAFKTASLAPCLNFPTWRSGIVVALSRMCPGESKEISGKAFGEHEWERSGPSW